MLTYVFVPLICLLVHFNFLTCSKVNGKYQEIIFSVHIINKVQYLLFFFWYKIYIQLNRQYIHWVWTHALTHVTLSNYRTLSLPQDVYSCTFPANTPRGSHSTDLTLFRTHNSLLVLQFHINGTGQYEPLLYCFFHFS